MLTRLKTCPRDFLTLKQEIRLSHDSRGAQALNYAMTFLPGHAYLCCPFSRAAPLEPMQQKETQGFSENPSSSENRTLRTFAAVLKQQKALTARGFWHKNLFYKL